MCATVLGGGVEKTSPEGDETRGTRLATSSGKAFCSLLVIHVVAASGSSGWAGLVLAGGSEFSMTEWCFFNVSCARVVSCGVF